MQYEAISGYKRQVRERERQTDFLLVESILNVIQHYLHIFTLILFQLLLVGFWWGKKQNLVTFVDTTLTLIEKNVKIERKVLKQCS